ncbi:hypothetical protein [Mycobacteroides chelonae]|uniref:hypothetical protein n=1 Tax=Mycobacteroides chelonae TaxID=1774 RepID=UPI001042578A|nr:hypothetical protein [Mycobacteroides chelonae]
MGVGALLVLDEVRDVDRFLGEMTVRDDPHALSVPAAVRHFPVVDALKHDVWRVELDRYYNPDAAIANRLFVAMQSNYWYPGMSHRTPGNWPPVSRACRFIWALEPQIVVRYMPEPFDWIGDLDPGELVARGDVLTPARVAEFDDQAAQAMAARESVAPRAAFNGENRQKRINRRKRSRDETR